MSGSCGVVCVVVVCVYGWGLGYSFSIETIPLYVSLLSHCGVPISIMLVVSTLLSLTRSASHLSFMQKRACDGVVR